MMPGMRLPDRLLWRQHDTPIKNFPQLSCNSWGELMDGKQFLGISSELALYDPFQGLK